MLEITPNIEKAIAFATEAHKNQKRRSGEPYIVHPLLVSCIVAHFGGGWIDENDCDTKEYYPIELNPDGNIKPVQYVTMNDIYEKFGSVVVITG